MQKEVTWQETTDTFDIVMLLDKVPLEATIWLIVTAVVVLIFFLGHYYIEAHRRDGPLVAMINKLEREVLILKKERCIMEDRLNIAEQQNANMLSQLQRETLDAVAVEGDTEAQNNELACLICGTNKRRFMTEPCGHFAMCGACVAVHRRTVRTDILGYPLPIRCPVCRGNLIGYRLVIQ